jgi:hypothetical protein
VIWKRPCTPWLVIHRAADDVAHDEDRRNGIEQLIMAGEQLAGEVSKRF